MRRPVVVLADSDAKYLRPLELKFIKELSGKIDLEVITDPAYFDAYFAQPRTVEILLIDEEWYSSRLSGQDIRHLFILSDSRTWLVTQQDRQYIFKYSSSSEIYNTVMRETAGEFIERETAEKHTKVAVVTSASGGVGKTTVALGLAACMSARMLKVLYINAERMSTFHRWFKNPVQCNDRVYAQLQHGSSGYYQMLKPFIIHEHFDYVPPFKAALAALGISASVYGTLVSEAKASGDYDVVIVDTDAVFDEEKAFLMTFADSLVTVVNQTEASVWATNILLSNVRVSASDKYIFVCNDFEEGRFNAIVSGKGSKNFVVSDYIRHIEDYDRISLDDLKNNRDIYKLSYLII